MKRKRRKRKGRREHRKENKFKKLISEKNKQVSHVCGWAEVRHGYMPVGGQEALIVPPCGVQVWPGAVCGVITPCSLVQRDNGQDEEEGGGGGGVK